MTSSWSKGLANVVGAGLMALGVATSAHADGYAAPGVAYQQPFNWTGLYIGGNAGWVDSSIGWVYHDPAGRFVDRRLCGGAGCDISQTSGIYGVHAGYQYQFGSLVLGLEVSLSKLASNGGSKPCFNAAVTCSAETDYLATLGPRLGWAVSNWMVYGTGGFAHGQISTHETGGTFATRLGHDGWFAGVGGEYGLTRNLILGLEYLHVVLDTDLHFSTTAVEHRNISADYDIVRARLSWKFDNEPRVARPLK